MANLVDIEGIGPVNAEKLKAARVDTVTELAQRKPENLHSKLTEVNESKKLVRRLPTLAEVTSWVEQAGSLPRAVEY